MLQSPDSSCLTIRKALLILTVLQVAGCGSPESRAQNYYENGMKLFSLHENAKAAIELRNAVRLKKDLIGAWKVLAEIDETSRNWPGVITDMRAIVDLAPNEMSARLKLGKLLMFAGSAGEALGLANAGLEIDDSNAEFHALKAAISLKLDDHPAAVREAQKALELDPTSVDALIVLVVDRLGRGDANGALSLLQSPYVAQAKALENNVGFQLLKIRLFGQTGDLKGAEAALKRLVELNPQEPGYRKLLVNFYVEQRRLDDAESEMRGLAAANPSDSETALGLVRFLLTVKKAPEAARQELKARINAGGEIFPYQIALAEMYLAEGNLTECKQLLEELIRAASSPEHVRTARIALAQMYLGQRNLDPAETLATEVLRDDSHNVPALKLRASIRLERAQPDAAIVDLLVALNYQPRSTDLMSLLARAYERSGLIEIADKQLADATRASNFNTTVGLEYAAFLQRRGSLSRAEDILIELNKRWPNNIQVLSSLAEVRLARQNWGGAQEIADSIRQTGDNSGIADRILGATFVGRNKYDEAIAAFQNAYNVVPTATWPVDLLVGALLKANRKDQATIFLKSVLAKNPGNANALVLLGSIQLTDGAADQALKSFSAAIKVQPNDSVGYRALADLYLNQKNYDEAIKVVRTGIEQQPDMVALHVILANALERSGAFEAAISEYEFILEKQPGNLIVANNLASLLLDHRTDKASLKKAQSLAAFLRKSQIPQFKDTLGWASYHQGDYRNAVLLSEEAAAALPDQATVRYHLGMSYLANNQLTKASEQFNKALELAPNDVLAKIIRKELRKTGS